MLQFTNHPLVDIGVAVIVDHFNLDKPEEITEDQLKDFGKYIENAYNTPYFQKYLFAFFQNSAYINPNMKEESKREELDRILYGYLEKDKDHPFICTFCGQPAQFRAYRQHIPLITGEGLINFFPSKRVGLEVCPYCLLAIQAFPLGTLKVSGQAFFVHVDDTNLILEFVHQFKKRNIKNMLLDDTKEAIDGRFPKTLFMSELIEVDRFIQNDEMFGSITVYHLTNFGTKADISMFHLPSEVLSIVHTLLGANFSKTWNQMIRDGWVINSKKHKDQGDENYSPYTNMNRFYEDLFDLPNSIASFIRYHFLGGMFRRLKEVVKDGKYKELDYWSVTAVLLKELVQVKEERVLKAKEFADKLVDYLLKTNDHKFFRQFYLSGGNNRAYAYDQLRNLFIKANYRVIQEKNTGDVLDLPITFEDFIEVFEQWDDTYSGNWTLGRDLVLLRVMERLYQEKWFTRNKDLMDNLKIDEVDEITENNG